MYPWHKARTLFFRNLNGDIGSRTKLCFYFQKLEWRSWARVSRLSFYNGIFGEGLGKCNNIVLFKKKKSQRRAQPRTLSTSWIKESRVNVFKHNIIPVSFLRKTQVENISHAIKLLCSKKYSENLHSQKQDQSPECQTIPMGFAMTPMSITRGVNLTGA